MVRLRNSFFVTDVKKVLCGSVFLRKSILRAYKVIDVYELDVDGKLDAFRAYLDENGVWYRKNYLIKYDTYFKMGGRVKIFVSPQEVSDLKLVVSFLVAIGLPYKIIGFTTNVLLLDKVEYSVIISTRNLLGIKVEDGHVDVDCGYSLQDFVRVAVMEGAKGFEGLEGIPGSIGGAIFMNAGAYGYDISDNLISVDCINERGDVEVLSREQCGFSYRNSRFKEGKSIILGARFKLDKGDRRRIERHIETYHIARHSYQEFVYPNLGSLFSINGDIYRALLKDAPLYKVSCYILKLVFKNPVSKFLSRKRPNNAIFNWLLLKYIKGVKFTPSSKSMNILINDGETSLEGAVDYIFTLQKYLGEGVDIENEIVLGPVYSICPDFMPLYEEIRENLR